MCTWEGESKCSQNSTHRRGRHTRPFELPLLPLENAAAIPRTALREGDVVWLVDAEQQLEIRPVDVGLKRDGDVLVTGGLQDGDLVISSPISVPVPGMRVRPTDGADELGGSGQ